MKLRRRAVQKAVVVANVRVEERGSGAREHHDRDIQGHDRRRREHQIEQPRSLLKVCDVVGEPCEKPAESEKWLEVIRRENLRELRVFAIVKKARRTT